VDIPEDFNPGMEATTVKNLRVLRNQGTWGAIRVAWEIQSAPESLARSNNAYDLFLLGAVLSGVKSMPACFCQHGGDQTHRPTCSVLMELTMVSPGYVENARIN